MTTRSASKPRQEGAVENPARERILHAAFSAFMERGYAETSTVEIATRAQVSKRALYALVGNKQGMLVACIRERAKRLRVPADLPPARGDAHYVVQMFLNLLVNSAKAGAKNVEIAGRAEEGSVVPLSQQQT